MKYIIVFNCLVVFTTAVPSHNNGRIADGKDAIEGQFPYQISLRLDGIHGCGGSILDATTILSAGHCVDTYPHSRLTVTLGKTLLSEHTEVHDIESVTIHPEFNRSSTPYDSINDVSIIKLRKPIIFREEIRPIKLRQTDIDEEDVVLSGWGALNSMGDVPDKLQYVHLKTLTHAHCEERMEKKIMGNVICAYGKPSQGACEGDSGSPLVDLNGEQVGIDSWGIPCAKGYPEVYTRVYSVLSFIKEHIQ